MFSGDFNINSMKIMLKPIIFDNQIFPFVLSKIDFSHFCSIKYHISLFTFQQPFTNLTDRERVAHCPNRINMNRFYFNSFILFATIFSIREVYSHSLTDILVECFIRRLFQQLKGSKYHLHFISLHCINNT